MSSTPSIEDVCIVFSDPASIADNHVSYMSKSFSTCFHGATPKLAHSSFVVDKLNLSSIGKLDCSADWNVEFAFFFGLNPHVITLHTGKFKTTPTPTKTLHSQQ